MKISTPTDCENSPEKRIVRDFLIAWHQGQWDQIDHTLHNEFSFQLVEKSRTISKEDLKMYLHNQKKLRQLNLEKISSYGSFGACKGQFIESDKTTHFAYFIEFSSAGSNQIKSIVLYNVHHV